MEVLAFSVCILMTVVGFFFAVNYKEISNRRIIKKRLKYLEVGEKIIAQSEYCEYIGYVIKYYCKGNFNHNIYPNYIEIIREE